MSIANGMLLDDIIQKKQFHHVCQPIYALETWDIFGYEALLRCKFYQNPEHLFQLALEENRLYELDTCSVEHALSSVEGKQKRLFVNIYPSTVMHSFFPNFLNSIQSTQRKVVFEINEGEKLSDMGSLRRAIFYLKNKGYTVALDDFGKRESKLQTVIDLKPDFVKLDRYYSVNLAVSEKKQDMIKRLLNVCHDNNMKLILEGIEEPADLAIAKALGVHFGQGYLLGNPFPLTD
jgi:EAL domain-containing protein (putative c-di-GMP-specific phosphodiesterase class I)